MGWNIFLAAIEDCEPKAVVERLGLGEPDAEEVGPSSLPFGEATNAQYADDYIGVGKLGDFTLVTSRMVRSSFRRSIPGRSSVSGATMPITPKSSATSLRPSQSFFSNRPAR